MASASNPKAKLNRSLKRKSTPSTACVEIADVKCVRTNKTQPWVMLPVEYSADPQKQVLNLAVAGRVLELPLTQSRPSINKASKTQHM